MDRETLYYLGFSACPGIGPKRFAQLLQAFGSAENAWGSSETELKEVIGQAFAKQFVTFRQNYSLEGYGEALEKKHITPVTWKDKEYPALLKQYVPAHSSNNTFTPPYVLYVKGNVSVLQKPKTIGIVGTRKVTDYGREVTKSLTGQLVREDFTVVSGLALGVDGIAHQTTLENNGLTIAVLGSSVDVCTPGEHQRLYDEILEKNGCIVSQFALNEHVGKGHFPARNMLIAALSQGVLVTEGAEDSGSLITAQDAQKLGKPVFAVPGPITSSLSKGTNNLLKKGGIPITEATEILDRLGIMVFQKTLKDQKIRVSEMSDNPDELSILSLLENGSLQFDEIVRTIGKDSKSIGSLLSLMELKGLLKSNTKGEYTLNI